MKVLAIILLLVGLGAAGMGVSRYIGYSKHRSWGLSDLDHSKRYLQQAASKQGTAEGDKLLEEGRRSYQSYQGFMDYAEGQKGYMIIDAIIGGVALLLSVTLFVVVSRRRRASHVSIANSSAF
jgi:hypothetical protein